MKNNIGKRVNLLIKEKGFTSVDRFLEYVDETQGEAHVSRDTVYKVINGQKPNMKTLYCIANALELPIECLTSEYMPFLDSKLELEVQYKEELPSKDKKEQKINDLKWVKNYYDISKRVYPNDIGDIYDTYNFKITTLAELSIYFPLCDMEHVMMVMSNIAGVVDGYEQYILEKYRWLYMTIPDSPAKKYADCQAILMRLRYKENLTEKERLLLEQMISYEQSDEYEEGYKLYTEIIENKTNFYRTWRMMKSFDID